MAIEPGVQIIEFISAFPSPGTSDWKNVGPQHDIYFRLADTVDGNGNIIDPDSDIEYTARQIFSRGFVAALFLGVRMRYDTKPVTTNPVVKVFGRVRQPDGTAGPWQILKNRLGDASVVVNTDPSDIVADIGFASTADPEAHYFELQGCNEFLVGVEVASSSEDGGLDVKFI